MRGRGLYSSGLMAEFQWWLLLVGLVAGGGLVAVVSMDGRRRDEDLVELERRAETTWIVDRLAGGAQWLDAPAVDAVLQLHREYLGLPPPDELIVEGAADERALGDLDPGDRHAGDLDADVSDVDPDRPTNEIGDDRGRGSDEDLARAREEQAAPREEAHAGTDREQRGDR
jgi:hypothetical protein